LEKLPGEKGAGHQIWEVWAAGLYLSPLDLVAGTFFSTFLGSL
jgi:hypothetical protein